MSMKVYVVNRRSNDVSHDFCEIKGIFLNKDEAAKHREYIWEKYKVVTVVTNYTLLDTLED